MHVSVCLVLQVDPVKLRHAVKVVAFNQFVISGSMVVAAYYVMSWRGNPCGPELPTFHWALMELAAFSLVEEVMFYYSHRFGSFRVISLCKFPPPSGETSLTCDSDRLFSQAVPPSQPLQTFPQTAP